VRNTVVVQSCKKFSEICKATMASLVPYDFIDDIILSTDDKNFPSSVNSKIKLVQLGSDGGFSSNMITALDKTEADRILVILDDYVLPHPSKQKVNQNSLFESAIKSLGEREDVACIRLNIFDKKCADFSDNLNEFVRVRDDFKYICSLQPAVWRTESLKKLLKKGEDAWTAELSGSKRMRKLGMRAYISQFEAMAHINALRFGKYVRDKFVDYADENNIGIPRNMDVFVKKKLPSGESSEKKIVNISKYRSEKKH